MRALSKATQFRRGRKLKLIELIENLQPVEEQRLMGIFSLQTGLRFKTIGEYLDELEAGCLINREEGAVSMVEGSTE